MTYRRSIRFKVFLLLFVCLVFFPRNNGREGKEGRECSKGEKEGIDLKARKRGRRTGEGAEIEGGEDRQKGNKTRERRGNGHIYTQRNGYVKFT